MKKELRIHVANNKDPDQTDVGLFYLPRCWTPLCSHALFVFQGSRVSLCEGWKTGSYKYRVYSSLITGEFM